MITPLRQWKEPCHAKIFGLALKKGLSMDRALRMFRPTKPGKYLLFSDDSVYLNSRQVTSTEGIQDVVARRATGGPRRLPE